MSQVIYVAPQVVAAAKLKIKRDLARGRPVDPATRAIADARPSGRTRQGTAGTRAGDARTD